MAISSASAWLTLSIPDVFLAILSQMPGEISSLALAQDELLVRLDVRDADADEPESAGPVRKRAVEESASQFPDPLRVGRADRGSRGTAANGEIRIAKLGRDGACDPVVPREVLGQAEGHAVELGVELLAVGDIPRKGLLLADGDIRRCRTLEPPRVDSPRTFAKQAPDLPREHPCKISVFQRRQPADLIDPGATEALLRPWTDARQEPHGERRQKRRLASRRHDGDPARLAPVARHLGDDLAGCHAQRAGETRRSLDGDLDGFCQVPRLTEVRQDFREIEVALVHPRALHRRDDLAHDRPDGA